MRCLNLAIVDADSFKFIGDSSGILSIYSIVLSTNVISYVILDPLIGKTVFISYLSNDVFYYAGKV